MKKLLAIGALLLVLGAQVFAGFDYKLDLISFDPIYQEYTADRDRAGIDFQVLKLDKMVEGVYQNGTYFKFNKVGDNNTDGYEHEPLMVLSHLGETLSLGRHTFSFDHWLSPVSFDLSVQGAMIIGMEAGMADMIGYDGVFFYGLTASVADRVSLRFGNHHYCTHYGDGTLKQLGLDQKKPVGGLGEFTIYKKYIRMEALVCGLSVVPYDGIRLYGEFNWCVPALLEHFDTYIFAPGWRSTADVQHKDESFNSYIANFGVELSYDIFPKLGKTTLSYDCHAYEEGKIKYKKEDLDKYPDYDEEHYKAYYDKDAPWEFEHEIVLSQQVNDLVSFEVGYHHGRFPLNSFYHHRCNYVYVGARLNHSGSVTAVDTAK